MTALPTIGIPCKRDGATPQSVGSCAACGKELPATFCGYLNEVGEPVYKVDCPDCGMHRARNVRRSN